MVNSEFPDLMLVWKLSPTSTTNSVSGNFFTISLKKRAGKTMLPVELIFKSLSGLSPLIVVWIEISALLPVYIMLFPVTSSFKPVKIGIVVLEEIALWTIFNALMNEARLIENFIF